MKNGMKDQIEVGDQVYVKDGGDEIGAVRDICKGRPEIIVYVENAGDFTVSATAITAVHFQKVIVDPALLPEPMKAAVARAHDAETL